MDQGGRSPGGAVDTQGFEAFGTAITFSPDGSLLAVGLQRIGPETPGAPPDGDSKVLLWDVGTHQPSGEPLRAGGLARCLRRGIQSRRVAPCRDHGRVPGRGGRPERRVCTRVVGRRPVRTLLGRRGRRVRAGRGGGVQSRRLTVGDRRGQRAGALLRYRDRGAAGSERPGQRGVGGVHRLLAGRPHPGDGGDRLDDEAHRPQRRAVIGAPLPGEEQVLWRALFTPDGARVITISENHQGVAWGVTPDEWNRLACGIAGRQLSREEWTLFLPDRPYDPACADGS